MTDQEMIEIDQANFKELLAKREREEEIKKIVAARLATQRRELADTSIKIWAFAIILIIGIFASNGMPLFTAKAAFCVIFLGIFSEKLYHAWGDYLKAEDPKSEDLKR